jgi:CheY-like chemotaxis protein
LPPRTAARRDHWPIVFAELFREDAMPPQGDAVAAIPAPDAGAAKAMKGDREKRLDAGAADYLVKPVNTEQLLSTLRMWLHR